MAPYDIPAGSRYAYVINDALENCTCVVLLLTNASQSSQFVEREIERAITYKKPIIPLQMEDLELNSGFKFYIGSSQIIAVPEIRRDAPAVNQAISGIRNFLSPLSAAHQVIKHTRNIQKHSCRITIWSPVNVEVFLNDKRHQVLKVDHNSGFDYSSNTITAGEEFTLIFSSKGFEKEILFDMPSDGELKYHLKTILTADEIAASYDREEAIKRIKSNDPTGYSFEQLGIVGEAKDIGLLGETLKTLSAGMTKTDQNRNYLIARCAVALGKLCIKYSLFENAGIISKIYDKYPAKKQYGYYFDYILKTLMSSIDEKFRTENREL